MNNFFNPISMIFGGSAILLGIVGLITNNGPDSGHWFGYVLIWGGMWFWWWWAK